MTTLVEYEEWLASGHTDQTVVECIDVRHSSFTNVRIARWHENLHVRHESGNWRMYTPGDFRIEAATTNDSTNQTTQGIISALGGALYEVLLAMTPADRADPLTVKHRLYFADNPVEPLINPPPLWTVAAIQVGVDVLTAELQAVPLRARTVGNYYTLQNFPILKYV